MHVDSPNNQTPSRGLIAISITLLMAVWAINFLIVKIGLRHLPALTFASFRLVAAGIFMLLIAPLFRLLPIFRDSSSPSPNVIPQTNNVIPSNARDLLPSPTGHDLWTFAYLGFFGVSVNQLCFTLGLRYTNVTHSSIIVGMAPMYTLALALIFRLEQLTWAKALGMAIAFSGVAILASGTGMNSHSPTLLGDAITMCGSLGFAMYVVLGKRVAARYNALTMTTWNFIFGALIILPIAIQQALSQNLFAHYRDIPWQAWACIVYTGLFSSTLAYLFYFWLLRYLEASQLASFSYLLPVSASALSIMFLGERGSWLELLGGALALLGVYTIESSRNS
jgi:drug/metabolite transporter (DMT)-like permease